MHRLKAPLPVSAQPPDPGDYCPVVIVAGRWRGVVGFYDDDDAATGTAVVYPFEPPPGEPHGPRRYVTARLASLRCLRDYVAHAARWREPSGIGGT